MNREKKALLLLWTYIIIFLTPKIKSNNHNKVTYNDNYIYNTTPYATYDSKDIYIIGSSLNAKLDNNIYIVDDRKNKDPDMSVYNSYQYKNIDDINTIINILIEYEEKHPSNWNRSFKSMKNEWIIHNICYFLNIQQSRTEKVDFNNTDEETYLNIIKILKEIINTKEQEKVKTLTK